MKHSKQRLIVNTHLQELALMLLAGQPIKDPIQKAASISRGKILADLEPEGKELYLASQGIIREFVNQLANCENLEMLAKVLQIVQGITNGSIVEYKEIESRIIDEPSQAEQLQQQ